MDHLPATDFEALTLKQLRQRQSVKWQLYPQDVLPMWVAELDVPLAAPVAQALTEAIARGDTGYPEPSGLKAAFARFAGRHWQWEVDPHRCWAVGDVMSGVMQALALMTSPGDAVVICPPVYHPFFDVPVEAGRRVVRVPLQGGRLDVAGIDAAFAAGATALLLCSPHNPTGAVWSAAELQEVDAVAQRHGALVIADEIHAPLTLPGATFTPYLTVAQGRAVALHSASKAFNLAGLKAALIVAGRGTQARLATMPVDVAYRIGHFGTIAGTAAFDAGDAWLAELLRHLDRQRTLLGASLPPHLTWTPPQASYLAWLHFGEPAPAARLLAERKLALSEGSDFGTDGWARLNFGTTTAILTEALSRLA